MTGLMLALYVIGAWWGSTGLLLYLIRQARRPFTATLMAGSVAAALGAVILYYSSRHPTVFGACAAFAAILLMWGWLELSFLLGVVTGPRRTGCPAGCRGKWHVLHAIEAILYHELATVAVAILVTSLTWDAPNLTGLWTFLLLWVMRISAKLNLFLGVPNTGEVMLPAHLRYLGAFFRRRRMNPLFPISITITTLLCVRLISAAAGATGWNFDRAQATVLAVLASMAWFEHWMLILPMSADALWKFTRTAGARAAAGRIS
jgi:putative photosynthetic complex assembly protein 2